MSAIVGSVGCYPVAGMNERIKMIDEAASVMTDANANT
jgi:hypothetical protein